MKIFTKKRYGLIFVFVLFLTACSSSDALKEYRAKYSGMYIIYCVYKDEAQMDNSTFGNDIYNSYHTVEAKKNVKLIEGLTHVYDDEKLKELVVDYPAVIVFDKKGKVLSTANIEEFQTFIEGVK